MDNEEWDIRRGMENRRLANLKIKNQIKCPDCGLFGCICQTNLKEFWDRKEFLKGKVSEVYRLALKILNDINRDKIVEKDFVRLKKKLKVV